MAKRVSRKLLLGLGSTLTFGTIGVVGGFGIKSIIDLTSNNQINQFSIKALAESQFSNAPDYNVATKDMFIDPSNLKRFHFGNTLIGQTVTPYGWLGVFDDPYKGAIASTRIVLTGWNGEILWVNEPTDTEPGLDDRNYNVYDMEYDFKNDLIFVLRTWSSNGFLNDRDETFPPIRLDILDAKTGKAYNGSSIKWQTAANTHILKKWQEKALNGWSEGSKKWLGLKNSGYLNWKNQQNRDQSKNLYQLDLASSSDQKNLLLTWMPDFMRLTKNFGSTNASSISLKDFIQIWRSVAVSWIMLPENIKNNSAAEYSVYFDLLLSDEINIPDDKILKVLVNGEWKPADQFYLIANPFFTVGKDNSNGAKPFFIMHILFADKNGNVYHKIIGWDEVASRSNANGVLYKKGVYDKTQRIDWREKTNFSDGSGILVESGKNGSIPSWVSRDKYISREVINANTRINKNMFNNNSILFSHPYGAATFLNKRYPIFNVAQMYVEPLTGFFYGIRDSGSDAKKIPRQFYFGRDIEKNNKEIAHYPGANPGGKGTKNNINQTYHRLISVSPFDNTFIYAERPNIKNGFFEQGANDSVKDWAGFFIGKAFRNSNDVVRPFFVWNSNSPSAGSLSNLINPSMTSFEKLYEDGFTFDLRSFQTSGTKIGLNLYFNQNGNSNGTANSNGFKSRKIGMMPDIFTKIDNSNLNGNELWIGNGKLALQQTLKNPTQFYNFTGAKIETNSFSTLIHSRANLDKWYSRTLFNNINPSNLLTGNSLLNNSSSENTRAVASVFNKKLTGNDFESTGNAKKSIDMVSNWETNSAGYNRLLVQRPQIKVRSESVPNNLPIETIYPFTNDNFLSQNIWINSNDKNRLIFKTTENLSSASYQIFSSWKEQVRMKSIGSTTNNLSAFENPDFKMSASWFDIRKNADSNPFGKFNNNLVLSNNKRPLRMLLQISKPTGTMPNWFNKINQSLFKKYPLAKDVVNGETSFEEILKQFIEEKTRKIDLSENNNAAAVGLGNLRIDAFLDINPSVISTSDFKIYTNGNKRMVVQNNTGLRIIYEDKYTEQWHQIYDQNQIKYNQFSRGGFGEAVRNAVQTSWDPKTTPSTTTKLKVSVNAEHFQDNLVRKSNTEKKIFTFERDNSNNLLIIPTDAQWLRSRLLNFQRLINMRPIFEYWTDESKTWKTLKTLNDDWFETNWPANQNNFTLPASTVTETITKLRLKLKPNDKITANDPNSFVELNGYVESESSPGNKFISDPQEIGVQKIDVNNAWFNQVTLQNSSSLLQNINGSDFEKFETNIFNNSNAIKKNPALRKKVKLMYKWNGENTELDKNGIANLIQERLRNFGSTDQGVFALWNGTTGFKIQAIFTTVDDSVSFVVNNNDATESQLKGDVKSDIKNEINLGTYINELTSNPINALTGNIAGEFSGTSIQFPSKSGEPGTAQFAGKTYEQIKEILNKVDVSIQYKQWENGKWSSWINDLNQVTKYDPTNPEIKIGFKINSLGKSWNIKLKNNNSEITNDTDFTLKLNLPKLVKLPSENEITELINQFNNKNVFGKNTYDLSVNETSLNAAKTEIINILKTTSANNNNVSGYDGLEKYIDLQFQLGNSQWYSAIELKKWLLQSSIDQENNALKMKIIMTENTSFILEEQLKMKEFELLNDGNKVIKKYIHGTKIEPELNKITASGLSTSITYTYPPEIKKIISGSKQGLKLQYTYNPNLDVKDATSNWVDVENANLPTSNIPPTIKKIYVRVSVTDSSLYDYGPELDGTKIKGFVDLENLRDQINVDSSWLNLPFPKNQTINLKDINIQAIDEFESRVFNSIQSLTPDQKDKLLIKYYFNNNNNTQLDKNDLLNEISKYKNSGTFDILQLWNTHQGVKISATFVKKDSGGNYDLIWANNNRIQNLDTSKVVTTIDLTSLVTWLEQIKVNVVKNGQAITSLIFPTITTEASNPFNGKEWSKTEDALESLAIKVQYQEVASNVDSNKWNETMESIKNHDNRSQFKIRFVLEKSKGKNLIVKIKNGQELIGTDSSDQASQPVTVNLAIPKVIQIDGAAVEKFRNSNPFSGNTKKIKVDENSLNNLINDIKTSSLNSQIPSIASAPLQVKFRFGTTEEFRELNEWIKYLKDMNTDQSTNKIQIKFNIAETGSNEWAIDNPNGFYTIEPNNVPIYVHDQGIHENIKMNTTVSGTNDALEIRFPSGDGFYVDDNNEIKGTKGLGLKLQFSLDPNDDVGDNSKWTDQRPTKVPPGINSFFIRIIPINNNYVYEKQVENDYRKIQIIFTVIQKIRVEKSWLNEFKLGDENNTNTKIEITQLSLDKIKKWIAKIQDKIKTENKVSEAISKKINIKFSFKNENDLDAEGLFNKINSELKNFNGPDLGIVQLWNKIHGDKINAKFVAEDQTILIQDSTGNTANLLDDLLTDNIYTKVNLSNYVQVLETEFTNVVRSSSLGQGQMNSFTPPNMTEGNMQFGGKTYNQISSRLSDLNIKILFKDPNGTWVEKDSLKIYDPQTALLPLAFVNNSDSNIYLEIRNSQSAC